jgi:predicted acetyltransferase
MPIDHSRIAIEPVPKEQKETLRNLLEKYLYEFSQYEKTEVDEAGLYGYKYLDNYWTEEKRFPFFIKVDGKLAGFFLVNDYPEEMSGTDYCMSEFFVMYKYRGKGVGSFAARYAFEKFRGKWQLKYHPANAASAAFWNKTVSAFTGGKYKTLQGSAENAYEDGSLGVVLAFTA